MVLMVTFLRVQCCCDELSCPVDMFRKRSYQLVMRHASSALSSGGGAVVVAAADMVVVPVVVVGVVCVSVFGVLVGCHEIGGT